VGSADSKVDAAAHVVDVRLVGTVFRDDVVPRVVVIVFAGAEFEGVVVEGLGSRGNSCSLA
jgi:hypothetical protein